MIKAFLITSFLFLATSFASTGEFKNFTKTSELKTKKILENNGIKFEVIPKKSISLNSLDGTTNDVVVSYPRGLIGQSFTFGTVITKESDKTDVSLGNLKLASFSSLAKTELVNTSTEQKLVVRGAWAGTGSENDAMKVLAEIPVTEVTADAVTLNLSALGSQINIAPMLGEMGEDTEKFIFVESKTVSVDFSLSTLVFDVDSRYRIEDTNKTTGEKTSKEFTLTTRWFMKLNSLTPFFVPRKNTEGVGYFTNGESNDYISRFPITDLARNPVKYYVKNIPLEQRPAMLSCFEDWNHKLQPVLGHDLLVYEVLEKDDPRYNQIVAGDIRYNVLEWDIDNLATYGGLGPSISSGVTGEMLAAHVLIQGPTILGIYKKWFKVKKQVASLRSLGKNEIANSLEKKAMKELFVDFGPKKSKKFNLSLGQMRFKIPAQDPRLEDPASVDPLDYHELPEGYTYETYMNGYWREIVAHELGHNLGLRHNFRGNLKDTGEGTTGSVSRSIMEYLPRSHRHLDRVSEYDVMAISYGYLGKEPEHKDWFCTDEDQGVYSYKNSAECSSADATENPVAYFESRVNRGLDLLLARNSSEAPEWKIDDVWNTMGGFMRALSAYAYTAPLTADKWTNFFKFPDRPKTDEEVPAYIIKKLNNFICGADLESEVMKKDSLEAQNKAMENLRAYRAKAFDALKALPSPWGIVSKENFSCYTE